MTETCIPFVRSEDYDSIKALLPNHSDFSGTYDEWLHLTNKKFLENRSMGHAIKSPAIKAGDFAAFCRSTGQLHDAAALTAFCFQEAAHKPHEDRAPLARAKGSRVP